MHHFFAFLLCSVVGFYSTSAFACSAAPNHSVALTADDSPECLLIEDAFAYDSAALRIRNDCEEMATIAGVDCERCGDELEIGVGEMNLVFVVETEEQIGEQTIAWSVGEQTGTVTADVAWQDNSNACAGFDDDGSCSTTAAGTRTPILFLLIGLVALRRRRC